MSTKVIIGVVAIVVVLGAWYVLSHSSSESSVTSTPTQTDTSAVQPTAQPQPQSGSGTIGSLLAMGNVECTVSADTGTAETKGTVFVSGGKMKGDFSTTIQGKTIQAHMINDGSYVYTWSDVSPKGLKFAVTSSSVSSSGSSQGVNSATPANYSCQPWTPDLSVFAPPTTVTFMTPGATPATHY